MSARRITPANLSAAQDAATFTSGVRTLRSNGIGLAAVRELADRDPRPVDHPLHVQLRGNDSQHGGQADDRPRDVHRHRLESETFLTDYLLLQLDRLITAEDPGLAEAVSERSDELARELRKLRAEYDSLVGAA